MEKENIILQFISVWCWHLTGIIFLVSAFIIFFSGEAMGNTVMFIVFIASWGFCEYIAFSRKNKLEVETYMGDDSE